MRPVLRWGVAGLATALLALTPYAGRLYRVSDPDVSTAALVAAVRASAGTAYSATVEVDGHVGLPIADHFSDLADLFGGTTRLRVWWRDETDWRVDRLLDTGEVDLFHLGQVTTEWDYERGDARYSRDPEIRLPRDSDLLPPEVARRALDDAAAGQVTSLPARRIAGVDAAGLRVPVTGVQSSLRHVDLWVDPATGVTLAARVYGVSSQPAVSTTFTTYSSAIPGTAATHFRPAPGVTRFADRIVDIADAADEFAPVKAPASLAGLSRTSGSAAALYGHGLTRLLAIPLPYRDADELAAQLTSSGATVVHGQELLRAGPLGVLVTRGVGNVYVHWLLAGTVTDAALRQAARELTRTAVHR
ncbi:MAG TPA: hypothetical protein VHW64_04500 [Nocardioides sp.]|uniref:hypothetical protein n=1 Tax=Nocardioides sp. TaxID=35761 RepID=UPI002E2F83F5|nr:hypothetical protein [Nocardioides sp.]HEX3929938.1 hypothetical protein [Nocardioides sp.]